MQPSSPVLRRGLCLLIALFVLAWAAGGAGAGPLNNLAGSEWGFAGETDEHARYLRFGDHGQVGGMLGCNHFRGRYSFKNGELRIGPLANTLIACPSPMMTREREFLTMLEDTRGADARRRKLILKDADGEILAELVRRGAD